MTTTVLTIGEALPAMQALASRLWSTESRHHPGQLAWSAAYALPEELDHGPVLLVGGPGGDPGEPVAWGWAESDDWLELCVDPAHPHAADVARTVVEWFLDRAPAGQVSTMVLETEGHLLAALEAAGFTVADQPWFIHHTLDLATLRPVPEVGGYAFRHITPDEHAERAAVHRAAWSATSKVSTGAYDRLAATPPYRHDLDWVAVRTEGDGPGEPGEMVASVLVWLDPATGVALVEPVGCVEEHGGRGLAGAVSLAALTAARDAGATTGLVCPRGDDGYPVPQRIYRRIGFEPGPRTLTLTRTA